MKKLFIITLGTIIFNALTISAQAQSGSSCFMLDSNGNPIDLSYLCQNSNSRRVRRSNRSFVPAAQPGQKSNGYVVPIKSRRSGIPVIDVKFNNKYVFEMMLDTGASGIVITQKMAQKLKVRQTESVWVSTPSSNYFKMPAGYVYSVGVGNLKQTNTFVITSPSLDMGLLGQSFFGNYDITIKSDTVEFSPR